MIIDKNKNLKTDKISKICNKVCNMNLMYKT